MSKITLQRECHAKSSVPQTEWRKRPDPVGLFMSAVVVSVCETYNFVAHLAAFDFKKDMECEFEFAFVLTFCAD